MVSNKMKSMLISTVSGKVYNSRKDLIKQFPDWRLA